MLCPACREARVDLVVEAVLQAARRGREGLEAIEGYRIVRKLGEGGMGQVFLAQHDYTQQFVALKVMLPTAVHVIPDALARFLREMEVTRALRHSRIACLYDSGYSEVERAFFFTTEFCEGGTVHDLMRSRGGRIPLDEAMEIALQCLDALDYAHHMDFEFQLKDGGRTRAKGVVHRDLKPQNILLSTLGAGRTPKIADFGLAKAFDCAGFGGLTMSGPRAAMGSIPFMARQQAVSFKYAKPEVDIWAMAATLYTMVTGRFVRDFDKRRDLYEQVLNNMPVPILKRNSQIPRRLAEVIDRALVDHDYQDAGVPVLPFKTALDLRKELLAAI